jgi:hypothetical protein
MRLAIRNMLAFYAALYVYIHAAGDTQHAASYAALYVY